MTSSKVDRAREAQKKRIAEVGGWVDSAERLLGKKRRGSITFRSAHAMLGWYYMMRAMDGGRGIPIQPSEVSGGQRADPAESMVTVATVAAALRRLPEVVDIAPRPSRRGGEFADVVGMLTAGRRHVGTLTDDGLEPMLEARYGGAGAWGPSPAHRRDAKRCPTAWTVEEIAARLQADPGDVADLLGRCERALWALLGDRGGATDGNPITG